MSVWCVQPASKVLIMYALCYSRYVSDAGCNSCAQEDASENQRHTLSGNYGKPYEVLFVKDVR